MDIHYYCNYHVIILYLIKMNSINRNIYNSIVRTVINAVPYNPKIITSNKEDTITHNHWYYLSLVINHNRHK